MFKSRKKKTNVGSRRIARSFNDDDDENELGANGVRKDEDENLEDTETQSSLLLALHKKKIEKRNKKRAKEKRKIGSSGNRHIVRSFDIEEVDDDDDYDDDDDDKRKKRKKTKKRKRGLGFGGGQNTVDLNECNREEDETENQSFNAYGKEALEQLRLEQKRQTAPRATLESTTPTNTETVNDDTIIGSKSNSNPEFPEEDYISLDHPEEGNKTNLEHHDGKKDQEKEKIFVMDVPPTDESHGWEQQIEQRAGIKPSAIATQPSNIKILSLNELSLKLKSTDETIERQREELENSTNRLRAEREHALSNSKEHKESLRKTGTACEFYQSIRNDLTLWVGALRDLRQKVQPIVTAFQEMLQIQTKDFSREFRAWQDDCVATLYQTDRLDRVLGRQPESTLLTTASNEVVYDEFGRDVGSQFLRDRELRFKERIQYIAHKQNSNSHSSIEKSIIKHEDHNEEERSKILKEALSAALADLDQEYTSATRLKAIFDSWFRAYFDDYQQCFATLSFGDLYAVFVHVELCKSAFFLNILSSEERRMTSLTRSSDAPQSPIVDIDHCFLDVLSDREKEEKVSVEHKTRKVAIENEGRLAGAVEKGLLPFLVKIFKDDEDKNNNDPFFLFFSATKSLLLSNLIHDAVIRPFKQGEDCKSHRSSITDSKSLLLKLRKKLLTLVSNAIKNSLDRISIPLLNKDSNDNNAKKIPSLSSPSDASDCSIRFARLHLVHIIRQTLCNIILHWFPLFDGEPNLDSSSNDQEENAVHHVLNFISEKYLMLLSSIEPADDTLREAPSSAKVLFKPVWEALNAESKNVIESPSLMLSTMPLRAAARAYGLN